jgi:uncharacterized protein
MIRVVIDTNVVVSAHLKEKGLEAAVFQLALADFFEWFISEAILAEYELVLRRAKFSLSPGLIDNSLEAIRAAATMVTPTREVAASLDPDDNKFLECAEAANTDYLVTGNKRHFPAWWESTRVLSAREFIERITPELTK